MIAIAYTQIEQEQQAKKLAQELQIDCIEYHHDKNALSAYDYLLLFTGESLGLKSLKDKKAPTFFIDFIAKSLQYRSAQASRKKELLARAIGISPHQQPRIVDATAGLGRDGFILASLGYQLILLERSPFVYHLLADALERAKKNSLTRPIIDRLTLLMVDAVNWLKQSSYQPEVIYLDPMFPVRKKSAAVKKEMVFLQQLLNHEDDGQALFLTALSCASKRVVVKRPKYAAPLAAHKPSFSIDGNNSRFDVYLI